MDEKRLLAYLQKFQDMSAKIETRIQEEKKKTGKKLHMADGRIMQEAEKMIHQEFAYSLKLDIDEVASYIMNELHIETEGV